MNDFDFQDDLRALAEANEPSDTALERLQHRVLSTTPPRRRAPWMRRTAPVALAAAALLAAVALWPAMGPEPRTMVLETGEVSLDAGVRAEVAGRGTARSANQATTVSWVEGSITLDVDPARVGGSGREVRIETAEALVRVIGTVLTVERGSFGTEVSVERGKVETTCAGFDGVEILGAGQRTMCLRDAGAGLGYLLLLERQRTDPAARLEVIDRALAYAGGLAATRHQLLERRIGVLVELGRPDDAIRGVASLPPGEQIGRLSTGANDAMVSGGCSTAAPWLEALARAGQVTGALLQVQCLHETDPGAARQVLQAIDRAGLTPAQEASVAQWDQVLP